MAIQCQYGLEAHRHIITFLLHPHKFNLCHKINIVNIAIDDETFQQTFVNKTIRGSLKISIHVFIDCGISVVMGGTMG